MTITTWRPHGMREGDIIRVQPPQGPWRELLALLRSPRVHVVAECTSTSFRVIDRRMTWREWRAAAWQIITRR